MPGLGATLVSTLALLAAPPVAPPRASVVVEAPSLVQEEPTLPSILEDELGAVLWELGVGPRRVASDPVLAVRIEPEPDGYRYEIVGVEEGACVPCRREELVAALARAVERHATKAWAAERSQPSTRPATPAVVPVAATPSTQRPTPAVAPGPVERSEAPAPALGMRRAGIAMLAVYGACAVVGVSLIGIDRVRSSDDASATYEGVEYQGVGFAMLGLSVASLVVGGVLLGMSASRRRSTLARQRFVGPGFRF